MTRTIVILISTVFVLTATTAITCGEEAAGGSVEKKLTSSNKKGEVLRLLLSTFLASGDLENALRVTSIATALFPQDSFWWEKQAEINLWTDRPEEALNAYLEAYRLSGREEMRKKAVELAISLNRFDVAKRLVEKRIEGAGAEAEELKGLVSIYEQAGSIDELIGILEKSYKERADKELLGTLARLYSFYGRPGDALRTLAEMERRYGLSPEEALFYARTLYRLKRYGQALSVLKRYSKAVSPEDSEYWETMSDIAWAIRDYPTAIQASQMLHGTDMARQVDYERLFLWWMESREERALEYALEGWQHFGIDYMFYYFLNAAVSLGRWELVVREVEGLEKEDFHRFMKNPAFVSIYAQALANTGQVSKGRGLYEEVLGREFTKKLLADYLYFLLHVDDTLGLRGVVKRYSHMEEERELLTPFLLAYVRLQKGKKALELSYLLPRDTVDGELLYIDILRLYGREHEAEALRYGIYRRLERRLKKEPHLLRNRAFMESFLRVATYYEPPERIDRYFHMAEGVLPRRMVEDIRLSSLLWREERDRASYLLKRRAYMGRPWMYLNLALWEDERMKMLELLKTHIDTLPVRDRVEALTRTGRIWDALGYAYRGLDDNREETLLYTQYTELVSEHAEHSGVEVGYIMYGPYEESKEEVSLGIYLSKGIGLELSGLMAQKRVVDKANLVNPPSDRRRFGIKVTGLLDRGRITLALGRMKGLKENGFYRLKLEGFYLEDRLAVSLLYGKNLFTNDNVYLYLGGMRESYMATLSYNHSYRTLLSLELGTHNYSSQDGLELGSATILRQNVFYKVRAGYPDYTLRLYVESLDFKEDRERGAIVERLYPYEATRVLNRSYNLAGVGIVFGLKHRDGYTRVWRPFASLNATWNNRTDLGFDVEAGIGGGLFRQDNLSVGFRYVEGFKARDDEFMNIYLRYSLFH